MNCGLIKQKIDQQLFEKNPKEENEILRHIHDCPSCENYLKENKKSARLLNLIRSEPILNNPKALTESILDAIEEKHIPQINSYKQSKVILLFKRTLAAASFALLVIFGVENYIIINKISELENQSSFVSKEYQSKSTLRFHLNKISISQLQELKIQLLQNRFSQFPQKLRSKFIYNKITAMDRWANLPIQDKIRIGSFIQTSDSINKK
jgi:hypothetical protein